LDPFVPLSLRPQTKKLIRSMICKYIALINQNDRWLQVNSVSEKAGFLH
jgi:hypothetical protein